MDLVDFSKKNLQKMTVDNLPAKITFAGKTAKRPNRSTEKKVEEKSGLFFRISLEIISEIDIDI